MKYEEQEDWMTFSKEFYNQQEELWVERKKNVPKQYKVINSLLDKDIKQGDIVEVTKIYGVDGLGIGYKIIYKEEERIFQGDLEEIE